MALFDLLATEFSNKIDNDALKKEVHSVCRHLNQLLNSRRGVLQHLNDYGLPDVEDMYEALPYSQHKLAKEVEKTIEKYEPRVRDVRVQPVDINQDNCVIKLNVRAYLASGYCIDFDTRFSSFGKAKIEQKTR
ncbi:type VI secretion system baseplate subunit TssE [Pseudoalteromonas denitrificans]|uniref:Type VI secretion system protein n=1 Tax=Pseudoalteromonas denitrificans DSM 6059 TaxID=1123010 RepID=A0A1I1NET8_9GAMM|nr:type VI secretion system baseplate subunit TssE [Pseudoalteromonas denitrificans]SFC95772.1 type VI secretion system protein [Pseudoalteromonas denitrificans DSM 6059]